MTVAGQPLSRMAAGARAKFRREHCGVIFQDADLLDELDVAANVALPLVFSGLPRPQALERAREMLDAVGCSALVSRRPAELSGGEAQRVAVARAFVGTPSIVIADEPTASLDIDNAAVVTELIVHHGHAAGAATIIATHDRMVATTCDREVPLHRHAAERDDVATAER